MLAVARIYSIKKCFLQFCKNHRKTPVTESSFQQSYKFEASKAPAVLFSFEFCKVFKSMYFAEHLRTAASPISCLLGCLKDGRKMKGPSFVNFMVVILLPLFWFIMYFFPNALWRFLLKKLVPTLTPDNFAIPQKIL